MQPLESMNNQLRYEGENIQVLSPCERPRPDRRPFSPFSVASAGADVAAAEMLDNGLKDVQREPRDWIFIFSPPLPSFLLVLTFPDYSFKCSPRVLLFDQILMASTPALVLR